VRLSLLRYTTATRLDMYSTTHRCVELGLSGLVLQKQSLCRRRVTILKKEERAEKGAENKDVPAATARTSRAARATGAHEAVVPVETASWAPIALTVLGDQAVVMRREVKRPL
jgi:hypothetical protein